MPKPTTRAVRRKPMAVILMMTTPDKIGTPVDHDFEWFETDAGRDEFFKQWTTHATEDAKQYKDTVYLTAEIVETGALKLGRVHVAPQTADMKKWAAAVKKDPKTLLVEEAEKKAASPGGKVKPRQKSTAAGVVKGAANDKTETPKPKAKPRARKPVSADADAPAPASRAAALKARLDDKKAKPTVADAEIAALDAAVEAEAPEVAVKE